MKKNNQTSSSMMSNLTTTKTSLFDSILANEAHQQKEAIIAKHASRVGLLFKVMVNRELSTLQFQFEDDLTSLIKKYSVLIDDELSPTEED